MDRFRAFQPRQLGLPSRVWRVRPPAEDGSNVREVHIAHTRVDGVDSVGGVGLSSPTRRSTLVFVVFFCSCIPFKIKRWQGRRRYTLCDGLGPRRRSSGTGWLLSSPRTNHDNPSCTSNIQNMQNISTINRRIATERRCES